MLMEIKKQTAFRLAFAAGGILIALFSVSCGVHRPKETTVNKRFIPEGYTVAAPQTLRAAASGITAVLYSRGFAQGDAVYAEVTGEKKPLTAVLEYNGRIIPAAEKGWGWRFLFSIPPDMKKDVSAVKISCGTAEGPVILEVPVTAASGDFQIAKESLDLGKFSEKEKPSPEVQAYIDECSLLKKKAWAELIEDRFSSNLAHPRDMHYITSAFYAKRIVEQYKLVKNRRVRVKDNVKIHWGLDFRGIEGSPVYAMATGRVALSGLMYYEGNMIILDHGNGIFTYYMHMLSRNVKMGDEVIAGQQIGKVGSTGMSTGSHLHVSFFLNKEHADPLSLLCLPIRD